MEHSGEVVVARTMANDSSTIVASGGSASVQTVFTPPLRDGRDYELANIRVDNNSLKWSGGGTT